MKAEVFYFQNSKKKWGRSAHKCALENQKYFQNFEKIFKSAQFSNF